MKAAATNVPKIRKIQRDSSVELRKVKPVSPVSPVAAHVGAAVWEVRLKGGEPVGPVSADQIARGIRAGKVPSNARVRRYQHDLFWSDLLDIPDVISALKTVTEESTPPPPVSGYAPSMPSELAAHLLVPEFMVGFEGRDAVGPVSAHQIAHGIRSGNVPIDARIQRIGDLFAFDVLDEPDVIAALELATR